MATAVIPLQKKCLKIAARPPNDSVDSCDLIWRSPGLDSVYEQISVESHPEWTPAAVGRGVREEPAVMALFLLLTCEYSWYQRDLGSMENLKKYFDCLSAFDTTGIHSIDRCHNLFLIGSVLSKKPRNVLELGFGAGGLTISVIYALRYNGVGSLTCVDDWSAWGGREPEGIDKIRAGGVKIVAPVGIAEYLRQCPDSAFDLVVADALRIEGSDILDQLERVAAEGAFVFFRNSNRQLSRGRSGAIEKWLRNRRVFCYQFTESSRPDEHCEEGWLFSIFNNTSASEPCQGVFPERVISGSGGAKSAGQAAEAGKETLYLGLVSGENYGWGVCSRYLIDELSRFITCRVLNSDDGSDRNPALDGMLFQAITGIDFFPMFEAARGRQNIGYTFFENELNSKSIENASRFDLVLGGSSWCRDRMLEKGIDNCDVLIQGIDPHIHYPIEDTDQRDDFVIFSGGKFELRKGQDLVLKAVKILQEKYDNIKLVNCWYNIWPESMKLMAYSEHIRFQYRECRWQDLMWQVYMENGLDTSRVQTCELIPKELQRELYRQTDLGVFPNRCEGGTNLVLMEYMACGKPVVASYASGHKDVVTGENALLLNELSPLRIAGSDGNLWASWEEPSLDELVAKIEYAYHHRAQIREIGRRAGEDMKRYTWRHTAEHLLNLLFP